MRGDVRLFGLSTTGGASAMDLLTGASSSFGAGCIEDDLLTLLCGAGCAMEEGEDTGGAGSDEVTSGAGGDGETEVCTTDCAVAATPDACGDEALHAPRPLSTMMKIQPHGATLRTRTALRAFCEQSSAREQYSKSEKNGHPDVPRRSIATPSGCLVVPPACVGVEASI